MEKTIYVAIGLDLGWDCLRGVYTSIEDLATSLDLTVKEVEDNLSNSSLFVDQGSLTTVYEETICI